MSEYHGFTTRRGSDVYRHIIVQADNEEDARQIMKLTVLTSEEKIMNKQDLTDEMGEKQKLKDFLNEMNKIYGYEDLIVTGGTPTTISVDDF